MEGKNNFSRLSLKEELTSQITVQPLSDSTVRNSLSSLRKLVYSALGPYGRLKFFQTSSGGHVAVTSTSCKIVHHLSCLSHPIPRLILSAVRGHVNAYSDGGLRTALLMLSLIDSSLDLAVPRALITQIIQYALEVVLRHVESCKWKMKVDVGNIKSMMSVVDSIIGTKPGCHLNQSEQQFISVLLIKAFLQSLPSMGCPSIAAPPVPIQIMTCEGYSVRDSKILQGILLETPETPTFQGKKTLIKHNIKVALYNVSMAGDTEEWFNNSVKTEALSKAHSVDMVAAVLRQMIEVADWLVLSGVQMVGCQKCIHPTLKQYLRDKGVFVVDRLSILHISAVQRLTGCTLLSTVNTDIPESSFGHVDTVKHVVISEKSYIHLQSQSSPSCSAVCTLLVCSPDETSLEELKPVCQACISALHEVVVCPYVVPGAGCLDTHLASFLRHYGQGSSSEEVTEQLGCTRGQFLAVINSIASCLESLAKGLEHDGGGHVTDLANQHHWSLPPGPLELKPSMPHCMCGLVSRDSCSEWSMMGSCESSVHSFTNRCHLKTEETASEFENSILDVFSMKMNSYKTAFETAIVILRVHCLVCSDVGHE